MFQCSANVISNGAMWGPTGTDCRIIVYQSFGAQWCQRFFVAVKLAIDFFAGCLSSQENRSRFRVSSTWVRKSSQSCSRQLLSTVAKAEIKCSLKVTIVRLVLLAQWLWGGTRWMSICLLRMCDLTALED
jgi:hypothetical protein